MNVFITFLVGGGVLLSGIAWVVDRIASNTATPAGEEKLARQLGPISYPLAGCSSTTSPSSPRPSRAATTPS